MLSYSTKESLPPSDTLVSVKLQQNPVMILTQFENQELNLSYHVHGAILDRGPMKMFKRRKDLLNRGLGHTLQEVADYPYLLRQVDGEIDFIPAIKILPVQIV